MTDMNAMTRIVNRRRVPSEVVCIADGKRYRVASVDGREMVESGHYEWAPFDESTPEPVVTIPDASGEPQRLAPVILPPVEVQPVSLAPVALEATAVPALKPVTQTTVKLGKGKK